MTNSLYTRPQKLSAEFAGTFAIVLAAAGATALDLYLRGNQRTPLGALAVAAAYGVTFGACLAALGHISGGHFNPAITVAHWVRHDFGVFDTLTYVAAQLAGGIVAAYALQIAFTEAAGYIRPPSLAAGTTRGPGMLIEGVMTFSLVAARWATTIHRARVRYWLSGIVAGAVVTAAVYLATQYTGGAMNPARAFGPAVASKQWTYQPVYWIGPLGGAAVAATLYDLVFHRPPASFSEKPQGPRETAFGAP